MLFSKEHFLSFYVTLLILRVLTDFSGKAQSMAILKGHVVRAMQSLTINSHLKLKENVGLRSGDQSAIY